MGVTKRGDIWYIDYYADGRRYREAIGSNRKVAERALAKRRVEIAEGRFLDVKEQSATTFDEIAELFLTYSRSNKLSWERDERSVALLRGTFGGKRLDQITPLDVEQYKNARRKLVGPATVNKELACFKTMFSKAVIWGKAAANPVKKVTFFREPPGRVRFLSLEEIQRLLAEAAEHLKPILLVALHTGMRKSEILSLTWRDVDLRQRIIYVRTSKNGTAREVPMADPVYATLSRLVLDDGPVFRHADGSRVVSIRTAFDRAVRRAKIEEFSFHDLRHTFASYLVMNGVELVTVKELLGHKAIQMTLRYAHLSPLHKRSAVNTLQFEDGHNLVTEAEKIVAKKSLSHYPTRLAGVAELVDARDLKSLVP